MTIAAGFQCSDGVVLCADSQMTAADGTKYNAPKILPYSEGGVDVICAFAGAEVFSKMCIERLAHAILPAHPNEIGTVLTAEALSIHQVYSAQATNADPYVYDLDVLIAIRQANGRPNLYHVEGPAVSPPITSFECIGVGRTVARGAISLFHRSGLTTWEAVRVAAYCLSQSKEHVAACGGPSQITVLWNDDDDVSSVLGPTSPHKIEQSDILEIEEGFATLFNTLRPVFLSFNDTNPRGSFDKDLREAASRLKRVWKTEADKLRRLERRSERENEKFWNDAL